MSSTAAEPVATIESILAGVKGLGSATIGKAVDALDISGALVATPEQVARVADANAGKKDGLKGKALAMWVITGANSGEQAAIEQTRNGVAKSKAATSTSTASSSPEFEWPKKPAEILLDYLKAEVTGDADAPNKGAPFIDSKGTLRFHGRHWRAWLATQGMNPSKNEAGAPVRAAGMKMRPFALPGTGGRSGGFYTGPAPKGTASLPRRVVERAARGTGGGGGRKPANPFSKFTDAQVEYLRTLIAKAKKGDMKDAMLALLPAANPEAEPTRPAAAPAPEDAPQEPDSSDAGDTSPTGADAPQAAA